MSLQRASHHPGLPGSHPDSPTDFKTHLNTMEDPFLRSYEALYLVTKTKIPLGADTSLPEEKPGPSWLQSRTFAY